MKKNLLVITGLFPRSIDQSRRYVSYALVDIYAEMANHFNVRVVIPNRHFKIIGTSSNANSETAFCAESQINGLCVYNIGIDKYPFFRYLKHDITRTAKSIEDYLNEIEFIPDIIITHMLEPNIKISVNLYKGENNHICRIHVFHNSDIQRMQEARKYYICYLDGMDALCFRSYKLQKRIAYDKIGSDRIFFLISGVHQKDLINQDKIYSKIERPNRLFVTVSSLDNKNKNIDKIIKAFRCMDNANAQLMIIGDGRLRNRLEKYAGNADNIQFLGWQNRESVINYLELADVFILISVKETLGLVYFEAMAKGCIVIGSIGEGIDGVIENGKNGFLVDPKNEENVINILNRVRDIEYSEKKKVVF